MSGGGGVVCGLLVGKEVCVCVCVCGGGRISRWLLDSGGGFGVVVMMVICSCNCSRGHSL